MNTHPTTTGTQTTTTTAQTTTTARQTTTRTQNRNSDAELARLASDLRLACMRISRRVRYESDLLLPPHHVSVLGRLETSPRTNSELAEIERVSAPSMKRTTNWLVQKGYVARADDPSDRRQVILSLTAEGRKTLRLTRAHRDEWMLQRFEHLTDEEQALLASVRDLLLKVANE